jgi:quercetin 2,3-dioxygenase
MPAVTVDDLQSLPHIPAPTPEASTERPAVSVTTAPSGFEGEGFPVRRAFAGVSLQDLDPFVHMDQMVKWITPPANRRALRGTRIAASKP